MRWHGVLLAAFALAAVSPMSDAQPPGKLPKVGYLSVVTSAEGAPGLDVFRGALAALGYREGRTIAIDVRFAEHKQERLAALSAELVSESKVDVLVIAGCGKPIMDAARRASRTIPLVSTLCGDLPGFMGEVARLVKPGGNTTGQTMFSPEVAAKRLELLKELLPTLSAVAVLWNPGSEGWEPYWQALRPAASRYSPSRCGAKPASLPLSSSLSAARRGRCSHFSMNFSGSVASA